MLYEIWILPIIAIPTYLSVLMIRPEKYRLFKNRIFFSVEDQVFDTHEIVSRLTVITDDESPFENLYF